MQLVEVSSAKLYRIRKWAGFCKTNSYALYVNPVYFLCPKTLSSILSTTYQVYGLKGRKKQRKINPFFWFIFEKDNTVLQPHHWKSLCVRFSLWCPDGISFFHWISHHPTLRNCRNRQQHQRNSSIISCTIWPIIRWRFNSLHNMIFKAILAPSWPIPKTLSSNSLGLQKLVFYAL